MVFLLHVSSRFTLFAFTSIEKITIISSVPNKPHQVLFERQNSIKKQPMLSIDCCDNINIDGQKLALINLWLMISDTFLSNTHNPSGKIFWLA